MTRSDAISANQAAALFESLKLLPADQQAFELGKTDDSLLAAEVRSLLDSWQRTPDAFLLPPNPPRVPFADPISPVGSMIAGFRIQRLIGSGGMGFVYEAIQQTPRRLVALKIFQADLASSTALARFEREAEILGYLNHPNVAHVYQAGVLGRDTATPYFAMELVPDAQPITVHCKTKSLTDGEILTLCATVCDGVHHAHQKGVIHRDLKPPNILVNAAGQPKIVDFGVAKIMQSDLTATHYTSVGDLIGTVTHMSPEQFQGDPRRIDVRSDVYSLGVILFELLTGHLPHDLSGLAPLQAAALVRESAPRRPASLRPVLRGGVEAILLKALEKMPERRYPSAAELARDIRRYLAGEPVEAKEPGIWQRAVHWVVRHPAIATAVACSAIVLVAIIVTWAAVAYWARQPHTVTLVRLPGYLESRGAPQAVVRSRAGVWLRTWESPHPEGILLAERIERPEALGGGAVALIARGEGGPIGLTGCVEAYSFSDLRRPAWTGRVHPGDLIPDPHGRGYRAEDFILSYVGIMEVFTESPGDEIIAAFVASPFSQSIIRVYGLDGEIRQEFWHDGTLGAVFALPESRRIVLAGSNSTATWRERGHPEMAGTDPVVVFAVTSQWNQRQFAFISPEPLPFAADRASIASGLLWYKCFRNEDPKVLFACRALSRPHRATLSVDFVEVSLRLLSEECVAWTINRDGQEVSGTRYPNNQYRHRALQTTDGQAPPWEQFHLIELPPIRSKSGPATDRP